MLNISTASGVPLSCAFWRGADEQTLHFSLSKLNRTVCQWNFFAHSEQKRTIDQLQDVSNVLRRAGVSRFEVFCVFQTLMDEADAGTKALSKSLGNVLAASDWIRGYYSEMIDSSLLKDRNDC
uniref:Uncharacterized protein n=1 Tax=Leviviridae sp. TaxID=2027243 RepID=A0A514D6A8_9VIRU|nr:MAG: hypothetical protein H1Rhizo252102e2141_000003 [Leviviridae sp.]